MGITENIHWKEIINHGIMSCLLKVDHKGSFSVIRGCILSMGGHCPTQNTLSEPLWVDSVRCGEISQVQNEEIPTPGQVFHRSIH